jgi:hypothetical protein
LLKEILRKLQGALLAIPLKSVNGITGFFDNRSFDFDFRAKKKLPITDTL